MTISSTENTASYAGNDSTTEFSFPYLFLVDGDLVVTLAVDATGVETTQTITTDYTVSGAGDQSGGTVTMVTEPATGETLVIQRIPGFTQGLDLVENDPFPSDLVEQALDKGAMNDQVHDERYSRTVHIQKSDTYAGGEPHLPIQADRLNNVLGFDANGDFEAKTLATLGSVVLSNTAAEDLGTAAAGTSAEVSRQDHVHSDTGITKDADNLANLASAPTARGNLGLATGATTTVGTVATLDVGVADGDVPQMDGTGYPAADGSQITNLSSSLAKNYLTGMQLSNGTDTAHDIDITVGEARDTANAADITIAAAVGKQIDVTWASGGTPGTPTGGLASSLTAPANDTWYHVFAIVVAGVSNAGFDTSATAANLVTDHSATAYRHLGFVLTDGSANIILFLQDGDMFTWGTMVNDVANTNDHTTAVTPVMTAPPSVVGRFNGMIRDLGNGNHGTLLTATAQANSTPSVPSNITLLGGSDNTNRNGGPEIHIPVDGSSQIRYRASNANIDTEINTIGWIDTRGRNN